MVGKARARLERESGVGALPAHGVECVEAQADGPMRPMPGFKSGIKNKRKARKCHWQEPRLCVTRAQGTVQTRHACRMEGVEAPGHAWAWLAKQSGWGLDTHIHVVGDEACRVGRQARKNFGPPCRDFLAGVSGSSRTPDGHTQSRRMFAKHFLV
jgi:hypothetical protein